MTFNHAKLKELIKAGGRKTASRLAGALDVSYKAVYAWSQGTVSPALWRIGKIAEYFKINPRELLTFD